MTVIVYPIRPIRIEGNLAYVPLTKGYEAVIDASDVHLVEKFNWHAKVDKYTVYANRTTRKDEGFDSKDIKLHQTIMSASGETDIDHRDGNGLNNRRMNLRPATKSQNNHNQRLSRANKSGVKGVCWNQEVKKWRAVIRLNRKLTHLGYFTEIAEASAAYAKASAEYHGEFGRLE